jgi:hypothetical protein
MNYLDFYYQNDPTAQSAQRNSMPAPTNTGNILTDSPSYAAAYGQRNAAPPTPQPGFPPATFPGMPGANGSGTQPPMGGKGGPQSGGRTMEFIDSNRNGVDDRDEGGQPPMGGKGGPMMQPMPQQPMPTTQAPGLVNIPNGGAPTMQPMQPPTPKTVMPPTTIPGISPFGRGGFNPGGGRRP